uniref:Uncharacterized protein n=1 Tax=Zooxanthella nutricula TaxID=1333877 RepID=A0A7S2IN85_9DINO
MAGAFGEAGPAPAEAFDAGAVVSTPTRPRRPAAEYTPRRALKIFPIVNPATGKSIDGMNFEPREPGHQSRMAIKNPITGDAVTP